MSSIFDIDWFKRSKNYTVANTTNKLGWDKDITGRYSSFLYTMTKANQLLNSNSKLAEELHNLAVAIGVNPSTSIQIDQNNDTSLTDGHNIVISKKFDTEVGNNYDILDLIIGLLCHEASHCLYTDFEYMEEESKYTKINNIIHFIHNAIEDEMIETKLGMKYPGYINFISQVKYYYFDKCFNVNNFASVNKLDEILNLFLVVIRYPKYINNILNAIEKQNFGRAAEYEDLFVEIKNILGRNNCLNPQYAFSITRSTLDAAKDIYQLLKKYINEDYNKDSYKSFGGSGSGSASSENSNSVENTDSSASSVDSSANNTENSNPEENKDSSIGNSSDNIENSKSFSEQEDEINNSKDSVLSKIADILKHCSSKSESNKPKTFKKYIYEKLAELAVENANNGTPDYGQCASSKIGKANVSPENIMAYNSTVTKYKKFINTAKKLFINNSHRDILFDSKFKRNGTLDTNKLVDAIQGINTIYKQKQIKKTNDNSKFALVLSLDESGSMIMADAHKNASIISIIINEALKDYPDIELFIYGHGDNVVKYINKKENHKYCLSNRILQGNQSEEISYKIILDDVKSQTNLPIILINITDSGYLSNTDEIKTVVDSYKKKNVEFNCIMLVDKYFTEYQYQTETNDAIYGKDNWVSISNEFDATMFDSVITKLSNIIKKNYKKYK